MAGTKKNQPKPEEKVDVAAAPAAEEAFPGFGNVERKPEPAPSAPQVAAEPKPSAPRAAKQDRQVRGPSLTKIASKKRKFVKGN